jgi:hypothetical protein
MTIKKLINIICILFTAFLIVISQGFIPLANAQQTGSFYMAPYILLVTPSSLNFPTTFYNLSEDSIIYLQTDPGENSEKILIADRRDLGGFYLTINIIDFSSITDTIPLSNLSIATLSDSSPESVDFLSSPPNNPPGTDSDTVTGPLDCDWDGITDFETACSAIFTNFIESGTPGVSEPILIIDGSFPTGGGRSGVYWLSPLFRLLVPTGTIPGDYSTTITYSLILT